MKKYEVLNPNAFDVLNEESLYWLGFLFADGHISKNNNAIQISSAIIDVDHVRKFKRFLKSSNPVHIYQHSGGYSTLPQVHFGCSSSHLHKRLLQLGMVRKSDGREAPESAAMSLDFWRGVVDGDGALWSRDAGAQTTGFVLVGGKIICEQFCKFVKTLLPLSKLVIRKCAPKDLYEVRLSRGGTQILVKHLYVRQPALKRKEKLANIIVKEKSKKVHFQNLMGQKFNRLTAIQRIPYRAGTKWVCECECGNRSTVAQHKLLSGHTKSCGCYALEQLRKGRNIRKLSLVA